MVRDRQSDERTWLSEERIQMDCRKMERQRMVIEMGSGTCLQYFRIFYRQDDPG